MTRRTSLALKPNLESVEDRLVTTVHPLAAQLGGRVAAIQLRQFDRGPALLRNPTGVSMVRFAGPAGQGALPSNYMDWGAISIWNTTNQRVTFSVSASTYRFGQFYNFTLRPGQHQVYYAAYDSFNNPPLFRVSFDPISRTNPAAVSDLNKIFERMNWYPRIGTEGRPYAIATNVSGLYLTPI